SPAVACHSSTCSRKRMAALLGKYWYSDPTLTPAASATRAAVNRLAPSRARTRVAASRISATNRSERACCGRFLTATMVVWRAFMTLKLRNANSECDESSAFYRCRSIPCETIDISATRGDTVVHDLVRSRCEVAGGGIVHLLNVRFEELGVGHGG